MSIWRKVLVVLPALVFLHLVGTAVVPLIDGLREIWQPAGLDEIYLLAGFPAGYAIGAALGLGIAPGMVRSILSAALILSIAGMYGFAEMANSGREAGLALMLAGFAAGLSLPVVARTLGLANNIFGGAIMALVVGASWWLSIPFTALFTKGLPVTGVPAWAGPFVVQGFLCVLWLPLVAVMASDRRRR